MDQNVCRQFITATVLFIFDSFCCILANVIYVSPSCIITTVSFFSKLPKIEKNVNRDLILKTSYQVVLKALLRGKHVRIFRQTAPD